MRIAVGGVHTECSTYNPVLVHEAEFRILRGANLTDDAYFSFLGDYPAEFVPTLHARAIAGGPVERGTYEAFKAEILSGIAAAGPLDGVYLAMHGAMYVEGMEDAEGDFITAVRALVGPEIPISASYDLHGNVSQAIIDALDMFSTYRTAPHIDVEATMRRAVTMLVRSLQTGVRPVIAWAPVPVVLPGERTSTEDEPARSLYAQLPSIDAAEAIWDASLMVGYVWADEPRATAAAIMTGTDLPALERAAEALAQDYWSARDQFVFGTRTGTIEECVALAIAAKTGPAIIAESGDNPTGGGVGDRADVLAELLRQGADGVVFAGIADRLATALAYAAGIGASLSLDIGGSLDPASAPVRVQAEVVFLLDVGEERLREAVLRIGGIKLVVTARRRPFHNIADFTRLGLAPGAAKILVVKSGYLSPELAPIANPSLMALSPGVVDQFVERLPRLRKVRPTYPFDTGFDWAPSAVASARAARVR
ncbi:M81 family metallopeptidase [Devosia sp. CN2-171]|uniref:M81 family metallopeptidase n=1 Tax=Devosia sp. CN2-171 TaxID=3400909 RepID=UPI003BF7A49E